MSLFDHDEEYRPSDDKDRLFETHERNRKSLSHYLKVFLIIALFVIVAGIVIAYFMMPGVGDRVKAPDGLEDSVRMHFTEVEKRIVNDTATYYCDGYYWVRVEVERRPDVPGNPLNSVAAYRARAVSDGSGGWSVTALPILEKTEDVPCRF